MRSLNVGSRKVGSLEVCIWKVSPLKVHIWKVGTDQISPLQIGPLQIFIWNIHVGEFRTSEIGAGFKNQIPIVRITFFGIFHFYHEWAVIIANNSSGCNHSACIAVLIRHSCACVIYLKTNRLVSSCCVYQSIHPRQASIDNYFLLSPQLAPHINRQHVPNLCNFSLDCYLANDCRGIVRVDFNVAETFSHTGSYNSYCSCGCSSISCNICSTVGNYISPRSTCIDCSWGGNDFTGIRGRSSIRPSRTLFYRICATHNRDHWRCGIYHRITVWILHFYHEWARKIPYISPGRDHSASITILICHCGARVIDLKTNRLVSSCCVHLGINPCHTSIDNHFLLASQLAPYINRHHIATLCNFSPDRHLAN